MPDALQITNLLLAGAIAACSALIGLFFLRYWRRSGERLFLWFAIAFWILSANRAAIEFARGMETESHFYWVRLAAFVLILIGILDKNRRG